MNDAEFKLNALEEEIIIDLKPLFLKGILALPSNWKALILFAHGSGSDRFSPRNNFVARELQKAQFATLLLDLLSPEEEQFQDRKNVFDIELLSNRLNLVKNWFLTNYLSQNDPDSAKVGFFGASTGAGAAILATAKDPQQVFAIVSRGGRPDLAEKTLSKISVPTLLMVGGADGIVIDLNQAAFKEIPGPKELKIIPGATHLFEEPGALEEVTRLAKEWFLKWC